MYVPAPRALGEVTIGYTVRLILPLHEPEPAIGGMRKYGMPWPLPLPLLLLYRPATGDDSADQYSCHSDKVVMERNFARAASHELAAKLEQLRARGGGGIHTWRTG